MSFTIRRTDGILVAQRRVRVAKTETFAESETRDHGTLRVDWVCLDGRWRIWVAGDPPARPSEAVVEAQVVSDCEQAKGNP
jgi:hypothetical protein